MIALAAETTLKAPTIDYAALSPLFALTAGICLTLLFGLFKGKEARILSTGFALATLAAASGLSIWQWDENTYVVEQAMRVDNLAIAFDLIFFASAACALILSLRDRTANKSNLGDYSTLLLTSVTGMFVLSGASNLITLFIGLELLSVPLYVMCALELRNRDSLESGLKYLVIGSLGSAVLLYGLAFVYGATATTDFSQIATAVAQSGIGGDVLLLTGIGLVAVGLAFKASVAPFHQWTPDVYQGAPTPVTAFMAVATKAAAFAIIVRLFDQALLPVQPEWDAALAALATVSIVVGNVAAIGQDSLKRMLAYSGIAQAGYILAGVVVGTQLGVKAVIFYLFAYALMNIAAFAVLVARERETTLGDDIKAMAGLGASRPVLATAMTISMLSLAGFPATVGFFGKFFLIEATVSGGYTWLGVLIVIGSMISLVYYLRVIAAIWMQPAVAATPVVAGAAPGAEAAGEAPAQSNGRQTEVTAVAVLAAAATFFFGIIPSPLLDFAADAAKSLPGLS